MNARAVGLPIPSSTTASSINTETRTPNEFEKSSNNNLLVNNTLFTRNSDMLHSNNSNGSINNDNNTCVQITNTQAAISLSTVYVSNMLLTIFDIAY